MVIYPTKEDADNYRNGKIKLQDIFDKHNYKLEQTKPSIKDQLRYNYLKIKELRLKHKDLYIQLENNLIAKREVRSEIERLKLLKKNNDSNFT